jgi:L-threonylcarbamoyladenylate synthase
VREDDAVAALRAGEPVILPTDTVYGLCARADAPEPAARVVELKGREASKPLALLAADVEALVAAIPELRGRSSAVAAALLPGPYTLVLPNPAGRFPWLAGAEAPGIGVRVPNLPPAAAKVVRALGVVVATSANLSGGSDPRRLEDVPAAIRGAVAAIVDAGELPGTPSTVLDLTGAEPHVLREGAVPAAAALAAVSDLLREYDRTPQGW